MRASACLFVASVILLGACSTPGSGAASAGCWANAYSEPGFRGTLTTYIGPSFERRFMTADVGSLALGPQARLEGYAGPRLAHETVMIDPGSRLPDLRRLEFDHRVAAFELACVSEHAPSPVVAWGR